MAAMTTEGLVVPEETAPLRYVHVVPENRGHRTKDDGSCWCQPRVEWITGLDAKQRPLYIHKDEQA